VAALLLYAIASAVAGPKVAVSSPSPVATATPIGTLAPGMWRLDGIVTDEAGKPLQGVCVGIGPAICTDVNPRTDSDGKWFLDIPKAAVDYEFHFTKVGYKQFDMPIHAVTSQTFFIKLGR